MNDENKSYKVELSDEEMDNIAGGTAAVLHQDTQGHALWMDKCNKLNSASKFNNCFNGVKKCDDFKKDPLASSSLKCCMNCKYYWHFDMTKGEMDHDVINSLMTVTM